MYWQKVILTLTIILLNFYLTAQAMEQCPTVCPDGSRPYFCVCPKVEQSRPHPVYSKPKSVPNTPDAEDCNASRRPDGSDGGCPQKSYISEPEMVFIKGGCFMMGSPESEADRRNDEQQHQACVNDFYIGKYEITRSQFAAFVQDTGYKTEAQTSGKGCWSYIGGKLGYKKEFNWLNPGFNQTDEHPVVCVSWNDTQRYIQWLNKKTTRPYRLPTEAELEYVARAGTTTPYWWGNIASHDYANYGMDLCCEGLASGKDLWEYTAPVGSFTANPWGLYDTAGNVWEWSCSGYRENYTGAENMCVGREKKTDVRGGSWGSDPQNIRAATRNRGYLNGRNNDQGFRLCQDSL